MPLHKNHNDDYIPIKCEGWNGKFVYEKGHSNNVSKVRRYNQNITDTGNFYGCNREPTVLPASWDGTFSKSGETYLKQERNRSDDSKYFDYNMEPTVLPTTWNGEFELDPNDVRIKQERNFSDVRDYAEANRFKVAN